MKGETYVGSGVRVAASAIAIHAFESLCAVFPVSDSVEYERKRFRAIIWMAFSTIATL